MSEWKHSGRQLDLDARGALLDQKMFHFSFHRRHERLNDLISAEARTKGGITTGHIETRLLVYQYGQKRSFGSKFDISSILPRGKTRSRPNIIRPINQEVTYHKTSPAKLKIASVKAERKGK